ncbi:MAG: HAD-IA family hydrolase [Celeribacter sp.]|jgi:phosphoglycolate phosphatase
MGLSRAADPRPLRLVIFDVDGTLVDSQAHILAAMNAAFARLNLPAPAPHATLATVGLSVPEAILQLVPDHDPTAREALAGHYKASFGAIRAEAGRGISPLYPGAREVLDALHARDDLVTGLATGKSMRGLTYMLEEQGLSGFVTRQCADHHPSKPHPSMVLAALAETGVAPCDAVMVGDTEYDVAMAVSAGVPAIGVGWGYHPADRLHAAGAREVLDRFADLPAALDRLWQEVMI